jgi:hypothetical protein
MKFRTMALPFTLALLISGCQTQPISDDGVSPDVRYQEQMRANQYLLGLGLGLMSPSYQYQAPAQGFCAPMYPGSTQLRCW